MKKLFLLFVSICLITGCSLFPQTREVSLSIPYHPWENGTDRQMWYTLRWTGESSIESLHIPRGTKSATISVPIGKTVIICAYPLGKMTPFGAVIQMDEQNNNIRMTQNDGILCSYLINLDRDVTSILNYRKIKEKISSGCRDFRVINTETLTSDILNGTIDDSSFKKMELKKVTPLNIPEGHWVPASFFDASFDITSGQETPELNLTPGIHYYINHQTNIELRLFPDENSSSCFCLICGGIL